MNAVTFPLTPQMQGPDVADLQDVLALLLKRPAILINDEKTRQHLSTELASERYFQSFGNATGQLVDIFQRENGIRTTGGEVDSTTAAAFNDLLIEWGFLNHQNCGPAQVVNGQVRRENDVLLRGVRMVAFHGKKDNVIRLGEDTTDGEGRYTICYDLVPGLQQVDLWVCAVGDNGETLARSKIVQDAFPREVIDLTVPITKGSSMQRLEGKVVLAHGMPTGKMTLRLYQRGFGGHATMLAETTTVAEGQYAFAYSASGNSASLEVRAVGASGRGEVVLSKPITTLSEKTRLALNLVAPSALQPIEPEYSRLIQDVARVIGNPRNLADAQENKQQQDLTILCQATGWDGRLLAFAVMAERLSADQTMGLSAEVLYGLFRGGLPSDKFLLARVESGIVERILRKVRDAGIISLDDNTIKLCIGQFEDFASHVRMSVAAPGSYSTYSELLGSSGLSTNEQNVFSSIFLAYRGDRKSVV
jgi:hypothetical protein